MVFTTSICSNYLDKALVVASSIKDKYKEVTFVLCLVENEIPKFEDLKIFDKIVLAKDLNIPNFKNFIFQYDIVEASTAVKGHLMTYLMENYSNQMCVYIDPDCQVFSQLDELESITTDKPIVVAPHLIEAGNIEMEISSLKHGVFNLGFLALKPCEESLKFTKWWGDRLYSYSHADSSRGLFTDQKWINLAPCFFNVEILKHPGYDFATWSFMERKLDKKCGKFTVNEFPLRFVHFSGFDSGTFKWAYEQWGNDQNKILGKELELQYKEHLGRFSHLKAKTIPWSYGFFENGKKIEKKVRVAYSNQFNSMLGFDPFENMKRVTKLLKKQQSNSNIGLRVARKIKRIVKI